jgi:hypothetical protein
MSLTIGPNHGLQLKFDTPYGQSLAYEMYCECGNPDCMKVIRMSWSAKQQLDQGWYTIAMRGNAVADSVIERMRGMKGYLLIHSHCVELGRESQAGLYTSKVTGVVHDPNMPDYYVVSVDYFVDEGRNHADLYPEYVR